MTETEKGYDKDCDHIYGNMAKWPRKCFRCGGDEADIGFDSGFAEIEKAIERGKAGDSAGMTGECERCGATENIGWANEDGAFQMCIRPHGCMKIRVEPQRFIDSIFHWLRLEYHADCLTKNLEALIYFNTNDLSTAIGNLLNELTEYREKSTIDAEREADSKTIAALAEALTFYSAPFEWQERNGIPLENIQCPDFWDEMDFGNRAEQALSDNKARIAEANEAA